MNFFFFFFLFFSAVRFYTKLNASFLFRIFMGGKPLIEISWSRRVGDGMDTQNG